MVAMPGGGAEDGDPAELSEINVTPFIDVMLVLLIIFMVAAPLSTVDVPVDLPQAGPAVQAPAEDPLYLTIRRDKALVLGEAEVPPGGLAAALDQATGGDRDRRIFLRADQQVDYGALMEVMTGLRAAGWLKVALVGLETPPAAGP